MRSDRDFLEWIQPAYAILSANLKMGYELKSLFFIAVWLFHTSCGSSSHLKLERNRRIWRESNTANYRMTVDLQKTGHAAPNGKFIITVRAGTAESIRPVSDPEVEVRKSVLRFDRYDTVEDIFNFIEATEKEDWDWNKREIEYDPQLGYPKKVNVDARRVFDEELFFEIQQFDRLE